MAISYVDNLFLKGHMEYAMLYSLVFAHVWCMAISYVYNLFVFNFSFKELKNAKAFVF